MSPTSVFRLPEIRVERKGLAIERVLWDPDVEGAQVFDLTDMRILAIEREVKHGELPVTKISVVARLVESNTESERQ